MVNFTYPYIGKLPWHLKLVHAQIWVYFTIFNVEAMYDFYNHDTKTYIQACSKFGCNKVEISLYNFIG